ncbi:MAG: DNA gyrase inhibitor YacG [Rhodoblastus sp.]
MKEAETKASARRCPICAKPALERYRPFCSKRCADIDLNRWLKGGYAIPGAPDAEEDGDAALAPRMREDD